MLKIEELSEILVQSGVDLALRSKIIKEAEVLEAEKKADRGSDSTPKSKNEFVIMVRGDEELAKVLQQGWIVQIPQGGDPSNLPEQLAKAAKEQNNAAKRKKTILQKYSEVFAFGKRKFSKSENFQVKTKQPVRVVVLEQESF